MTRIRCLLLALAIVWATGLAADETMCAYRLRASAAEPEAIAHAAESILLHREIVRDFLALEASRPWSQVGNHVDRKSQAIILFGEMRCADDATIALLVRDLAYGTNGLHLDGPLLGESFPLYPAAGALARIGRPTVPALLTHAGLATTPDREVVLVARVLLAVLGENEAGAVCRGQGGRLADAFATGVDKRWMNLDAPGDRPVDATRTRLPIDDRREWLEENEVGRRVNAFLIAELPGLMDRRDYQSAKEWLDVNRELWQDGPLVGMFIQLERLLQLLIEARISAGEKM